MMESILCHAHFVVPELSFVFYTFSYMYIGLTWQALGSGGSAGVVSVKRHQKLPPCPTETVPTGFNVDLLWAKAEPVMITNSDAGSTSMTTY